MRIISSDKFKATLKLIHDSTEHRRFCFVLGAGASYNSGISTGAKLANRWFGELEKIYSSEEIKKWIADEKIDQTNIAASYASVYQKRFEIDPVSGSECLINEMKDAKPTFGHFVLAQILTELSDHCVITTNFDSLIETSVFQFTNNTPLVCGHESLSGYAKPSKIHPLIIKIHRDLLLSPYNTPEKIKELDKEWKKPLDRIFNSHIPIIIGYGGNDGSLMSYFQNMATPSNFFWCGRAPENCSDKIKNLITKHNGSFVKIEGFDEIMFELLTIFDEISPNWESNLRKRSQEKITAIDSQFKDLSEKAKDGSPETEISAFEYSKMLSKEIDVSKKDDIYILAIEKYPSTDWLLHDYAAFLKNVKKDFEKADEYFLKALEIAPNNAGINSNYAVFLKNVKKDFEKAEKYYLKALEVEPNNADCIGNYAVFLKNAKKDFEKAEEYFLKALDLKPYDADFIGNYAVFLNDVKKDFEKAEEYFLISLNLDPNNANVIGNYASFLIDIKKDFEKAEEFYLISLNLDPNNANVNNSYAVFLKNVKKDFEKAEKYYLISLNLDPNNANNNNSYAIFLKNVKKDFEKSEEYFLKALELDPNNANVNNSYAVFLNDVKKDFEKAEKYYLKALEVEPNNANVNGNYAIFLKDVKKDFEKAEKYYLKALEVEPNNANVNGNYAQYLLVMNKSSDAAKYIKKAFEKYAGNMEQDLLLELWFYKYAHYFEGNKNLNKTQEEIEKLLSKGVQSLNWNLDENVRVAIENGHPDPEKLKEFANRITKPNK